jgi:hypothetical protein
MRVPIWRFRLRTLLILVMLMAALLGGARSLEKMGRINRHRHQAKVWAGEMNKRQELADIARSSDDLAGAAKWDSLAKYADGWRRVFEHLASGGEWGNGPPIPKNPE